MNERTFHVLVVAPLRAGEDHARCAPWTEPVRFERATFDEAMASVAPAVAIDVADPASPRGKPLRIELAFPAMRAFRPDVLLSDVPFLKGLAARAPAPPPAPAGGSLVDDILASMGSPAEVGGGATPSAGAALAALLGHPEVRSLERAWRGLHFLASRADRDAVIVSALAASAGEVDAALERVARRPDAAEIDLIVVDHAIGSARRDLDRLESWATRAEGIGAPLVANGLAELVGLDDLGALGRTQRRLQSSDDPRASAVRSVAARDVTRWIALALNGAVARPRHAGPVARAADVRLDEAEDLFLGPAYLVASRVVASFQETGWPCAISGPTRGVVGSLPVHDVDDRGTRVATPLEALASEEAAAEAAAAGLILLASAVDRDVAVVSHARTLYRGASTAGGASPAAAHGLADQLFVARLAKAIVQLAAAIPSDTPDDAARDVARVALADLFGDAPRRPELEIALTGAPRCLEVTVRPRGFFGVRLEEATLGVPLG
ncbi:MAG: type VI secretion system contractile sheath large subunit [Labilithrix sp.]|nr:type VI secretion system contractile sheath large subunit [Labilithrix sp.]